MVNVMFIPCLLPMLSILSVERWRCRADWVCSILCRWCLGLRLLAGDWLSFVWLTPSSSLFNSSASSAASCLRWRGKKNSGRHAMKMQTAHIAGPSHHAPTHPLSPGFRSLPATSVYIKMFAFSLSEINLYTHLAVHYVLNIIIFSASFLSLIQTNSL